MAALTLKIPVLVTLLVLSLASTPLAQTAIRPDGFLSDIFNLFRIRGNLSCSLNGAFSNNGTEAGEILPFSNATVQLRCGSNVISSATTDLAGLFSILMNPLQVLLTTLLNNCNLQVATSLATCNAQLPSVGSLISSLQFNGTSLLGLLRVANFIPAGFTFQPQV